MRAIGVTAPGTRLEPLDLPLPDPGANELLVRVLASSINPVDAYVVSGTYGTGQLEYPVVPGRDVCGTIMGIGEAVTGFVPGDRVLGCWTKADFQLGAWAEYMTIPADCAITHCPAGLSVHEAAALPLAGATAQLAVDALKPAQGESILIVGASGAVGCYAVQLAARCGARVIATAKSDDERRVRQLGAAETVDYTRVDVATAIDELCPEGVPLMFDIVNDKSELLALSRVVQDGGRVASARFAADRRALCERGISSFNVIANGCGAGVLAPALELVQAGALRILVSDVTPLEGLPVVLAEFQRGGRGKVVVDIGS